MKKDYKWSLNELYENIETKKFEKDFKELGEKTENLIKYVKENFSSSDKYVEKIERYITLTNEFNKLSTLSTYLQLRTATDADDMEAKKKLSEIYNYDAKYSVVPAMFNKFLLTCENLEESIEKSEILKEHKFFILNSRKKAKYNLSEKEELLISTMSITGSSAWSDLRDDLIASLEMKVEIEGTIKSLPFPAVRNLAYSENKDERKKGYDAELKHYKEIDKAVAGAINSIKGEAIAINKLRGLTPLDKTLILSGIDTDILDCMIDAMKESMPQLRKYFKRKGELLGYKNGLPFYELFAPIGNVELSYTYDEALNNIVKNLSSFHETIGEFVKKAVDNNWIDGLPRDGKRDGAFCANIPAIKESRILSNFSGTYSCMGTLAHELGHGYHGECIENESLINTNYPMPIAETASIFFETLLMESVLKDANDEEKIALLNNSLTDETQVIIDIYSRFVFERNMIEARENGPLSVDELCTLMVDAQKEAYGDGLSSYHPYMWLVKPHYYSVDYNFYNFPYAFGLLFSKGVYAHSKKVNDNDKFIKEYKKLLSLTGKESLVDVGKQMDIDITDKEFWKNSLKISENNVDLFLKLTK